MDKALEIKWQDPRDGTRWTVRRVGEDPDDVRLVFWSVRGLHYVAWTEPGPVGAIAHAQMASLLDEARSTAPQSDMAATATGRVEPRPMSL